MKSNHDNGELIYPSLAFSINITIHVIEPTASNGILWIQFWENDEWKWWVCHNYNTEHLKDIKQENRKVNNVNTHQPLHFK